MYKIIAFHSFRRGTGKSNITANVACLLAHDGLRVGVIDSNIISPSMHILFGMQEGDITHFFNDYLWGDCDIADVVCDITHQLDEEATGKLFFIPANTDFNEIIRLVEGGYDIDRLNDGFHEFIETMELDFLIIDSSAGLNETTLLSIAIADKLVLMLRLDEQDYRGTSMVLDLSQKLGVPEIMMVVNEAPEVFDFNQVRTQVEQAYGAEVAAVIPFSQDLLRLGSEGIFTMMYPDHPMTESLHHLAEHLTN